MERIEADKPDSRHYLHLLALNRVSFLKPREKLALLEKTADLSALFKLGKDGLESILGRRIKSSAWNPVDFLRAAERDLKTLTHGSVSCIFYWDAVYPPQLKEIYDPPVLLFYRGVLPDFKQPMLGVVGTRRPTGLARSAAFGLGLDVATHGISVVSGLARGIDSEAHAGCLEGGGRAVAVLGNGLNSIYPRSSSRLAIGILKSGGIIFSEYSPDTPPARYNFPARNRIISGLSRSVAVIQAPASSGALITADYALEQGRDLYIHQVGLRGITGEGSQRLAAEGAKVIQGFGDILSDWGGPEYGRGVSESPESDQSVVGKPGEWIEMELAGRALAHNGYYFKKKKGKGPAQVRPAGQ